MLVRYLMSRPVTTFVEDDSAVEALRTMRALHIRHVPVLRDEQLVGVVTERDLLRKLPSSVGELERMGASGPELAGLRILHAMTRDVVTIRPGDHAEDAALLLREHKIGGLPVVEAGRLVGMVTAHDLFGVLIQDADDEGSWRVTFMAHGDSMRFDVAAACAERGLRLTGMMRRGGTNGGTIVSLWLKGEEADVRALTAAAHEGGYLLVQGERVRRAG